MEKIRSIWDHLEPSRRAIYETRALQFHGDQLFQGASIASMSLAHDVLQSAKVNPVCRTPFDIFVESTNKQSTRLGAPLHQLSMIYAAWSNLPVDTKKSYEDLALTEMAQAHGVQPTLSQSEKQIPIRRSDGAHRTGFEIYEAEHFMSKSTKGAPETRKAFVELCWRLSSTDQRKLYETRADEEKQKTMDLRRPFVCQPPTSSPFGGMIIGQTSLAYKLFLSENPHLSPDAAQKAWVELPQSQIMNYLTRASGIPTISPLGQMACQPAVTQTPQVVDEDSSDSDDDCSDE
jgi:hypothetical protein